MAHERASSSHSAQTHSATEAPSVRPAALVLLIAQVASADALTQVLANIPRDTNAAFVALADARRGFSAILCERLRGECNLQVNQLAFESDVLAGQVLVVPAQMSVEFKELKPSGAVYAQEIALEGEHAAESPVRMRSIASRACSAFGASTVAVMLSGLSGDAVEAVRQVREAGGHVITQDAATAIVVDGPKAIAESNLADEVLPLWAISSHLTEYLEGH